MRIAFDDTKANEVVDLLQRFMCDGLNVEVASKYEYGMNRIQRSSIIYQLGRFLADFGFWIGGKVTHANGIGNNWQSSIFYNAGDETQEVCYLNCNIDPFGVCYMSLEDYNGNRITGIYKLSPKR